MYRAMRDVATAASLGARRISFNSDPESLPLNLPSEPAEDLGVVDGASFNRVFEPLSITLIRLKPMNGLRMRRPENVQRWFDAYAITCRTLLLGKLL